jgi:DNA-binding NtrC family response regulator
MTALDYLNEPVTIQVEAITLQEVMKHHHGNQSRVADLLGGSRSTLRKRIAELDKGKEWLIQVHRSKDGRIACLTWFNGDA